MRACFLGQNIRALGYGVATLQTPPLVMDVPAEMPLTAPASGHAEQNDKKDTPVSASALNGGEPYVANSSLLCA